MPGKMKNQSTDSWNTKNGVDAVGKTMKPIPAGVQSTAVPKTEEFNGFESDAIFSREKRGASD